jgi:hypothetical protein
VKGWTKVFEVVQMGLSDPVLVSILRSKDFLGLLVGVPIHGCSVDQSFRLAFQVPSQKNVFVDCGKRRVLVYRKLELFPETGPTLDVPGEGLKLDRRQFDGMNQRSRGCGGRDVLRNRHAGCGAYEPVLQFPRSLANCSFSLVSVFFTGRHILVVFRIGE